MITRRTFAAGALALAAAPLAARAQQQRPRRFAWVHPTRPLEQLTESGGIPQVTVLHTELRRLGWVENGNLMIEYWSGVGRGDVDDWIRQIYASRPDVIYFGGYEPFVPQILRESGSVPTVVFGQDPIALGLVKSIARPESTITGVSVDAGTELIGKLLQLVAQGVPGSRRIGYFGPRYHWETASAIIADVAATLGVTVEPTLFEVPISPLELRRALATLAAAPLDAVLVGIGPETTTQARLITEITLAARLPAIGYFRNFAEFGQLMAYGPDLIFLARRSAGYIDKILRGARPGDLPVQQPEVFEFVVNLKTAKALGITIPDHILVFASEIIE